MGIVSHLLRRICAATIVIAYLLAAVPYSSAETDPVLGKMLGLVVPMHSGDASRAIAAIADWPISCSPTSRNHIVLVLYYSGGEDSISTLFIDSLNKNVKRCFLDTRIVYAHLSLDEDVYPMGPSVQFYKMFLDEDVKRNFSMYDAIAFVEWDVKVTAKNAFDMLYESAFFASEPFWVKGSTFAGNNFHSTAVARDSWHILGHINGNAIYNNTDPAFTEFVNYTLARWEFSYPYDVALWATIADFPYSWPVWQRFSSKFISSKLVANIGLLDVDEDMIKEAVKSGVVFIHGSRSGGG
ncbi:unnamed protein product, partial [Choristocarpus tenellus]